MLCVSGIFFPHTYVCWCPSCSSRLFSYVTFSGKSSLILSEHFKSLDFLIHCSSFLFHHSIFTIWLSILYFIFILLPISSFWDKLQHLPLTLNVELFIFIDWMNAWMNRLIGGVPIELLLVVPLLCSHNDKNLSRIFSSYTQYTKLKFPGELSDLLR